MLSSATRDPGARYGAAVEHAFSLRIYPPRTSPQCDIFLQEEKKLSPQQDFLSSFEMERRPERAYDIFFLFLTETNRGASAVKVTHQHYTL